MTSLIKWKKHPANLVGVCKEFQGGMYTDAVVICGSKKFPCHQAILSASSEVFDLILRNHPVHIEPVIVVDNVDQTFMEAILNYMYTGIITIDSVRAQPFLQCCSYFKIKGLLSYDVFCRTDPADEEEEQATITPMANQTEVPMEMAIEEMYEDNNEGDDLLVYLKSQEQSTPAAGKPKTRQRVVVVQQAEEEEEEEEEEQPVADLEAFVQENPTEPSTSRTDMDPEVEILEHEDDKEEFNEYFEVTSAQSTAKRRAVRQKTRAGTIKEEGVKKQRRSMNEGYTEEQLTDSMNAVCNGELNLSCASQTFNVPKSVLWRKLQKRSDYVAHPPDKRREAARNALLNGESMQKVSKQFNVPLATLYRDKQKLINDGQMDHRRRTKEDAEEAMRQALRACDAGMAQNEAARTFNVSKSTLWRRMRKA